MIIPLLVSLSMAGPLGPEPRTAVKPAGVQASIDLSGDWNGFCPQCPAWRLAQTGNSVTASWRAGPGHEGLVGEFRGTLVTRGTTVAVEGSMNLAEGSVRVTGTMTLIIRSPHEIELSYNQSNGYRGNATLRRDGGLHYGPVKIDIRYHANNLLTEPPSDGGTCPGSQPSRVMGTITAQITEVFLHHEGSGDVQDHPHLSRCRVPVIQLEVDKVELRVLSPGKILQATLSVHIKQEGVHRPGNCLVGTRGTIVATFDETTVAANGLPNHSLQIGPWEGACGAHTHLITNNITPIPADGSSSTWVRVWIGCKEENSGVGPANCK